EPIQLYGDGTQSRDFTFVDDIAAGVVAALRPVGFEIVNLGGGQGPVSVQTLIENLERLLDRRARVELRSRHAADVTATWADIGKAQSLLAWQPSTSLASGLRQTVDWYRGHRSLATSLQLD
ncbi:MAG TPA: NAD-dependent epimerase/dehydratase family protein, partial [Pirellulaceae bacterium]